MDREQAKALLPIMQAYSEGKTIQFLKPDSDEWRDVLRNENNEINFEDLARYEVCYRVKPEPKCRPFKNTEECWNEMQKHQPFGWLKDKNKDSELRNIQALTDEMLTITDGVYLRGINLINGYHIFEEAVKEYTFADGTPFGIIEEE